MNYMCTIFSTNNMTTFGMKKDPSVRTSVCTVGANPMHCRY